jgi:hypothetical protein
MAPIPVVFEFRASKAVSRKVGVKHKFKGRLVAEQAPEPLIVWPGCQRLPETLIFNGIDCDSPSLARVVKKCQNTKEIRGFRAISKWYARRGSNPQPSAPEADALSN